MKIIKLGHYSESQNNENINQLFGIIDESLNQLLYKNVDSVSHYFPKNALQSIIKDKKFYFSDIEFLNDYSETESIYLIIEKEVTQSASLTDQTKELFRKILKIRPMVINDIVFNNTKEEDDKDNFIYNRRNYIFCCSLDNDCLSNWKYYGKGNGYEAYNISLNPGMFINDLKKVFTFPECKIIAGKVIYDYTIKCNFVSELMQRINKFLIETNCTSKMLYALETRLFYYLMDISIFFKDISYKDEKEYRFVISIDNSKIKSNKLDFDFRYVNNILIPFLKVPFEKRVIDLIVTGPTVHSDISLKGLVALLDYNEFSNTEVGISTIPLRY